MSIALVTDPYNQDGLHSIHNHDFMADARFMRAYARGIQAAGADYCWHWRVHTGLWAAQAAATLEGDFVECGVNRGFLASAIMDYLDWNGLGKKFFLLDTFAGLDFRYVSEAERAEGIARKNQETTTAMPATASRSSAWMILPGASRWMCSPCPPARE